MKFNEAISFGDDTFKNLLNGMGVINISILGFATECKPKVHSLTP
jgi:hypothetical protein